MMKVVVVKMLRKVPVENGYYKLTVKLGYRKEYSVTVRDYCLIDCLGSEIPEERRLAVIEAVTYVLEHHKVKFDLIKIEDIVFG